jgi:hypothetical protein
MSGAHGHGHVEGDNKKIALLIAAFHWLASEDGQRAVACERGAQG